MDIDPFLKITHPSVTSLLQSSDDLATKKVGTYLEHARKYYTLWNDNTIPITDKLTQLDSVVQYFNSIHTHKSDIVLHMETSLSSLKALHSSLQQKYQYTIGGTSWLSTLVCENYFSKVGLQPTQHHHTAHFVL